MPLPSSKRIFFFITIHLHSKIFFRCIRTCWSLWIFIRITYFRSCSLCKLNYAMNIYFTFFDNNFPVFWIFSCLCVIFNLFKICFCSSIRTQYFEVSFHVFTSADSFPIYFFPFCGWNNLRNYYCCLKLHCSNTDHLFAMH